MTCDKFSSRQAGAITGLVLLIAASCHAQDPPLAQEPQDHSCTVNFAGEAAVPFGKDGHNFTTGWGFQAGVGFAVTRPAEPGRSKVLYITANFMYNKLDATSAALEQAKHDDVNLMPASSAHGSFSAVTLDPTLRFPVNPRTSLYLLGGFGWFRRGVGFNGANPATLTAGGVSLERLALNSGVLDFGGGVNIGLTRRGGLMLFAETRIYRGLAANSGTTLVPLSFGVRW